jgi:hypothetical protein
MIADSHVGVYNLLFYAPAPRLFWVGRYRWYQVVSGNITR